jgi:hypothetical protein
VNTYNPTDTYAMAELGVYREKLEDAMMLGDEVLIGQAALKKLDLVMDCVNQRLVPNPAHPD